MEKMMMAVVKENKGPGYTFKDVPVPKPLKGELLIRVEAVGICGTDLSILAGNREIPLPLIPGHEFAGEVVALGPGVDNFSIGERATAGLVIGCGSCPYCLRELDTLCDNILEIGIHIDGAFTRYVKAPAKITHKLPDEISFEDGALFDPIASAYRAVRKAAIRPSETVVVVGPGPIGLVAVQIAKAEGAGKVIVVGLPEDKGRLSAALENGADFQASGTSQEVIEKIKELTSGEMADAVIEATGQPSSMEVCTAALKKCGRLSVAGIFHEKPAIDMGRVVRYELSVTGSICYTIKDFQDSIELLRSGKINPSPLITHRMPLDELGKGLELLARKEAIKVILKPYYRNGGELRDEKSA